jgi:hypothetical protein
MASVFDMRARDQTVGRRGTSYSRGDMLILLALLLQAGTQEQPGEIATLEHVRRNLERDAAVLSAPPPSVPIFRVKIIERHLLIERPWQDDGVVPAYVRPPQPIYHYDFLYAVTPEAFRSATLYPIGVPVMPAVEAAQKAIAGTIRSYKQQRARDRVKSEIRRFRAENGPLVSAPR